MNSTRLFVHAMLTICATLFLGTTLAEEACCEVAGASSDAPACCAIGTDAALVSASTPWSSKFLRNTLDPLSGEPSNPELFLDHADENTNVYGRIYFASKESLESASEMPTKDLYEKAFLRRSDGTFMRYGKTRVSLDNKFCPVSGVGVTGGRTLTLDNAMATNCTAGSCSLGDGFKANFNAVEIGSCCPSCIKMMAAAPDKFLANLRPEIDAAFAKLHTAIEEETK